MAQVQILNGIYTDSNSDFRVAYPSNLQPIPLQQGISEGYLRPTPGLVQFGTGPGNDRGGINWKGVCYRVMGTKLVSINSAGVTTTLGDVGPGGQARLDYSFDLLAINSGARLYYWDGSSLDQVTDPDLGNVIDVLWIDGYFMFTDGDTVGVTELNDPFSVDPFKYGSSEVDPDSVKGFVKLRDEAYIINRNTIEVFQNVGGETFPFQRVDGGQIMRGAIGTRCSAVFVESVAFLGSGRNEPPAVWLASNGSSQNISSREIEQVLADYTESELALSIVEVRVAQNMQLLYVRLPDQTWVYDAVASSILKQPAWFPLRSSLTGLGAYRAANFIWCYNMWLCGDPNSTTHGYLSDSISSHYGETVGWEINVPIIYNNSLSAIIHQIELVCLTGRVALGEDPTIWTSYSVDGMTWSQEKPLRVGKIGERMKRIVWFEQGFIQNWRIQKFRGTSAAHLSIARLEMQIEALNA